MAVIVEKRNLCGLVIDAVIEENHSKSSRVTEHPVSIGSPISDHVYSGPLTLTIRGVIGATPPKNYIQGDTRPDNLLDSPIARATEELGAFNKQVNTTGITHFGSKKSQFNYDSPNSRISAAWKRLIELQENKEVCQVVSGLKVYDEMVVESVNTTQNSENCEKLDFTVTLKEIKRVRTQETTIVSIRGAKGVKDRGDQNPECLTLGQVFPQRVQQADAPYLALRDEAVVITRNGSVEANGEAGIFSPFTQVAWKKFVCSEIERRFVGIKKVNIVEESNPLAGLDSFKLFRSRSPAIIEAEENRAEIAATLEAQNQNQIDFNNNTATFASNACAVMLASPSCEFSQTCKEARFTSRLESEEAASIDGPSLRNVERSSALTTAEANTRYQAELATLNDPANQITYGQTLRDEFTKIERLECYQEAVLKVIEDFDFNGSDLDTQLNLVGFGVVPPSFPDINQIPKAPPPLITR